MHAPQDHGQNIRCTDHTLVVICDGPERAAADEGVLHADLRVPRHRSSAWLPRPSREGRQNIFDLVAP